MAAPTVEEMSSLLGETSELDAEPVDPYEDEDGEFMAAARAAVGTEAQATALQDAIEACLRKHGLLSAPEAEAEETEPVDDIGAGFGDI